MDREEKLKYEQGIEEYFDNHKVYDLFEKLFKDLIVNKPEDPVNYLIEHLEKKEQRRIFITGIPGTNRKDLGTKLSRELSYSYASTSDLLDEYIKNSGDATNEAKDTFSKNMLVNDDTIIEIIRDQLIKFEEKNESYIIEGFPKNRSQAIFLQSVGLLPDNVIILTTSKENSEKFIMDKLKKTICNDEQTANILPSLAKNSYDEAILNIAAVEDVFKGFYFKVNVDDYNNENDKVANEVARLLKFKEKTNAARMPPRIVLSGPPSNKKEKVGARLSEKMQIIHVSIKDLLNKEIKQKNENSKEILDSLGKSNLVSDKIILKLLEDRLNCSDCIINGWIVTGFPMNEGQLNFVETMKSSIKPSLLCYIDIDESKLTENISKLRYDLNTGKSYKLDGRKYNLLNEENKLRLVEKTENNPENLKIRIDNWNKILEKLKSQNWVMFNGNDKTNNICQLIQDKIGYNS